MPEGWPQPCWPGDADLLQASAIARVGARDYGLRRGFFRLAGALKALRLPYALAIDVLTAETRPDLVQACNAGLWGDAEWVAHGLSWNRPLHAGLDEARELAYLRETRERLGGCGIFTDHWLGIEAEQSPRTLQLLARAGYRVCLDLFDDEQPRLLVAADPGRAAALPVSVEHAPELWSLPQVADLDDARALCAPGAAGAPGARAHARRLVEAATVLVEEGRHQARVMVFALRPCLSGQPFRIDALLDALVQLSLLPGLRFATPSAIVAAWPRTLPPPAA